MRNGLLRISASIAVLLSLPTDGRFQDQSPENPVWVAFVGDAGTGDSKQAAVRDQLVRRQKAGRLDYVFLLGDNVYRSGAAKDIDSKYFVVYARLLLRGVKFHAALGNHDVQKCGAARTRPLPRDASAYTTDRSGCDVSQHLHEDNWFGYRDSHRYYSVRTPGAMPLMEVFVLDSNTLPSSQSKLPDGEIDKAQIQWLERALEQSPATWKIVVLHHPLHSPRTDALFSGHDRETGLDFLEDIFRRKGVDAVFQGHNHFYARMEPRGGVRYFVSGGGGSGVYRFKPDDGYVVSREDGGKFNHFVHVRVTRERFEYCTIDASGVARDGGGFKKGDRLDTAVEAGSCPFVP